MKLFKIRIPLAISDRDARRFGRLRLLLDEIGNDIGTERARLKDQHELATANAAFAFEAMENRENSEEMSAEVDTLTASIICGCQRSSSLKQQADFIEGTKQKLALLLPRGPTWPNPWSSRRRDRPTR